MAVSFVLLALIVALLLYGVQIYNNLVSLKHGISQAWANIDVLLQQRHDELPKLVEVCRQSMGFEQQTLERVIRARQQVDVARQSGNVSALGSAETEMRAGLGRLFAVAESYPELKTSQAFGQLQARISSLEESLADRRELYNAAVNANNVRIEQFPDVLISRRFGFTAARLLEVDEEHRADVDIKNLFGQAG